MSKEQPKDQQVTEFIKECRDTELDEWSDWRIKEICDRLDTSEAENGKLLDTIMAAGFIGQGTQIIGDKRYEELKRAEITNKDLLEACNELLENEPHGITPYFDEALRKAEAAIAKAEKAIITIERKRKMASKTQAEIDEQVKKLKAIRPNVKPTTYFGDSNLDKLDAQVKVLEEDMNSDEVWDEWPEEESDMEIRMSADDAVSWRDGESEVKDLAEDWPLTK